MTIAEFKEKVGANEELKTKLAGAKSLDDVVQMANDSGIAVTKEDLQEVADDDLDQATGAGGSYKVFLITVGK